MKLKISEINAAMINTACFIIITFSIIILTCFYIKVNIITRQSTILELTLDPEIKEALLNINTEELIVQFEELNKHVSRIKNVYTKFSREGIKTSTADIPRNDNNNVFAPINSKVSPIDPAFFMDFINQKDNGGR